MEILAIIPARSGSKSIPDKNIRSVNGFPLMAYSIQHAHKSKKITRVIVSTDDQHYAQIANSYGAETPFLRPLEISDDLSTDLECFSHALDWLKANENYRPDICVHLRPTHPVRNSDDIDKMIELLINNQEADSIRSIVENKTSTPYKMWFFEKKNILHPILEDQRFPEAFNQPRQALPKTYLQNASIDVVRTKTIVEKKSMSGDVILGYVMDEEFDIDYEKDLIRVENRLLRETLILGTKTYCFDIDGVIANIVKGNDYKLSGPINRNIEKINELYDKGNKIILHTARGSLTGFDWKEVTLSQLNQWGVKYHELYFGKPAADIYIDDRGINSSEYFNN